MALDAFKNVENLIPASLRQDRRYAYHRLSRLKRLARSRSEAWLQKDLAALSRRLDQSASLKACRYESFPQDMRQFQTSPRLPILEKKEEIISTISKHQVVIIAGATGSGKTTQIPKFCVAAGLGRDGRIGCTQPRRIAAISVAERLAVETGTQPGQLVGHKIRFADQTSPQTLIKIMTDGILLAEAQQDRFLNEYDALVVDEAHERSLNIDFILGLLSKAAEKRKDLKIIITSATIDTEKFSRAFNKAPIIEVSGRMYPVEVNYRPESDNKKTKDNGHQETTYVEQAVAMVDEICGRYAAGDILVFMPTAQDIRETCTMLTGRKHQGVSVLPLFARLSGKQQARVFARSGGRKIIVATNIAETSLTIPGIKYVVDTGLARISYYNPRSRVTSLAVRRISQSSAEQRQGRCGRVEDGHCFRLYSEKDFKARHVFTPPEVLRSNLAEVILRMRHLGLGQVSDFPFVDPPQPKSIKDGHDLLHELGAITAASEKTKDAQGGWRLTKKGRLMARIPVDPRLSAILIEAGRSGCLDEAVVLVSALSLPDIKQMPSEKMQEAREVQKKFTEPDSDFMTIINIWGAASHLGSGRLKSFCREHYLSFRRFREWRDVQSQIKETVAEHGLSRTAGLNRKKDPEKFYTAFHQAILSGFLSNIAIKKEGNLFQAAQSKEVMIFPGSTLFGQGKEWIVAAE